MQFIIKENNHFYEKIGNNEPICIDDEIPFEIPNSWEWSRLNSIGLLQTGNTPPTKNPENFGNHIPFIKPADISFSGIDYKNEGLSEIGKSKGRLIEKYSVLMVCIGGSRGKCYFNEQEVCCNQQINTITPILIDYKYLFYTFCSDYFQKLIKDKATGTATPIINKSTWGNFLIPIPSYNEQKRLIRKIKNLFENI